MKVKKGSKKILFYYPRHFNRSVDGTNPFFDPLIDACEKRGLSYDVMEEPDKGTDKPRNFKAKKGDFFFWAVILIRKALSIVLRNKDFYEREKLTARLLNFFTLNRYKYDNYITISGSMLHLFPHLNPKGYTFDMQHGIYSKINNNIFDPNTGILYNKFFTSNLNLYVWGKAHKNLLKKGVEDKMEGKIIVTGHPFESIQETDMEHVESVKPIIVVMLQFTDSSEDKLLNAGKKVLDSFLQKTSNLNVEVWLKHHPRYNNCINIDDLIQKHENVKVITDDADVLSNNILLHVTYHSTTAFEFAARGIPSFFLYDETMPNGRIIFESEYHYPLYWDMNISDVIERLKNKDLFYEDSKLVRKWYEEFYSPFDENVFIKSLKL